MKFFLKSQARYSLLLLALGGAFGPLAAQTPNTTTPTPPSGTTLPPSTNRTTSPYRDTIKPPNTNPNTRTLPNTGNPADTMRTNPLPPEGRTSRADSLRMNRSTPMQGSQRDSTGRRMMPTEGGTMPPQNGMRQDSMHRHAPKGTTPRGTMRDTMNHQGTMPNDRSGTTPQGTQRNPGSTNTQTSPSSGTTTPSQGSTKTPAQRTPNDGRSGMKPQQGTQIDSMDRSMTLDKNKSTSTTTKSKAKKAKKRKSTSSAPRSTPATTPKTMDKTGTKPAVVPDSTNRSTPIPRSGGN